MGLGCRFPGGIDSPAAFWDALERAQNGVSEVPGDRWSVDRRYNEDPLAPGKMATRWGGFLKDVASFDAGFFQLSPREVTQTDPQQRLMLEAAWEALEDAGVVPTELYGSAAGVFVGAMWQDYASASGAATELIEQHSATGWNNSIIPARIAYGLGLRGPALTVNTACSSSLVAVHLACNSLRTAECDVALAGAVNLMLAPHTTVQMTKFGAMVSKGQCRAFDAYANGYVRGEGCAVVVLKRLRDALRTGDRVYAVIRGSSVNNDGPSNGLTAPSFEAQVAVLRSAWAKARVSPATVAFVETHGPGTILGDPIEASALGEVFAPGRAELLLIGSVKTNLGHLEAAAGIAGLLKATLALYHGAIPPNLHFDTPNPHIDFEELKLRVVNEPIGFPSTPIRFAGVSSFSGFGGTNSHIALSEAPGRPLRVAALAADRVDELRARAKTLAGELLDVRNDVELNRVATRSHGTGPIRAVLMGRHPDEFQRGLLQSFGARSQFSSVPEGPSRRVFVFGGQGGQWAGMVQDLLASDLHCATSRFVMLPSVRSRGGRFGRCSLYLLKKPEKP